MKKLTEETITFMPLDTPLNKSIFRWQKIQTIVFIVIGVLQTIIFYLILLKLK